MTSCSCSCWRQERNCDCEWDWDWSWDSARILVMDTYWTLACMCGWLVFVFALCVTLEIVQIVQQLQSVQRLFVLIFSYRQPAASASASATAALLHLILLQLLLLLRWLPLAAPQCHTILIAQWQLLLFSSYNFKMNSWPVRRFPLLFDVSKSARSCANCAHSASRGQPIHGSARNRISLAGAEAGAGGGAAAAVEAVSYLIETCFVTPLGWPIKCLTLI